MLSDKKVVYYLCTSEERHGLVSRDIWKMILAKDGVTPAGISFDGQEVMMCRDLRNNAFYFVPTAVPLCWEYPKYLEEMNSKFGDFDFAGMVTWHEGASAPPKVLTVHSLGDVNLGIYGAANPLYMRNLLNAIEKNRVALGLTEYQTVTEATHWSGKNIPGRTPELILKYPVPMVDIEVGSLEESWADLTACQALADSLTQIFDAKEKHIHNILCVGGVHFDPNFAEAVFTEWADEAFGISHIIANQWLVTGEYEKEHGLAFASSAMDAIMGGVEAIAFHDKMKGCYKDLVRSLGEKYNVPILRHQRLRTPQEIEFVK